MPTFEQEHIANLIKRIAEGSQPAFKELYDKFAAPLYNASMVYTKDTHVAEEVVQEAFIRLWQSRNKLDGLKSLENYLFIVARNLALDHFRQKVVRSKGMAAFAAQQIGVSEDLSALVNQKEYTLLYRKAINAMPKQQRTAYILVEEEQLSYQEAADQMQLSRLTVKRHLEISRKFLRAYFKANAPGFPAILLVNLWVGNGG